MLKKSKYLPILILLLLSIITHFLFFGHPDQTVFDEVHFGKFVSGYFTHQYFFDIHPPLGKLLIAGAAYLAGFKPGFSFGQIGEQFNDQTYMAMRLLPTLAGIILPLLIYGIARRLGLSKLASLTAGLMIVLENALLVQSRFILLDAFLLAFGFGSLLAYLEYRHSRNNRLLVLAFALAALALSVKWTGLAYLGIIGLAELIEIIRTRRLKILYRFIGLIIMVFIIYFSIFAIHFSLLYKSGPGDAFMSQRFRAGLDGSNATEEAKPLNTAGKFVELNSQMYSSNSSLTATHPYSSKWYTWPFMQRPIFYWVSSDEQPNSTITPSDTLYTKLTERIYLLGNPVIWWGSTIAILYLIATTISDIKPYLKRKKRVNYVSLLLLGVFAINLLPFIGISRILFLYHYFASLIVAIIALSYILDNVKDRRRAAISLIAAALIAFIYFAPLSYGLGLTDAQYNQRVWFERWR